MVSLPHVMVFQAFAAFISVPDIPGVVFSLLTYQ